MNKIIKFFNNLRLYLKRLFDLPIFVSFSSSIKLKISEKKLFLLEKTQKTHFYFIKNNMWPFFLSLSISLVLLKIVFFLHDQTFFASTFINVLLFILLLISFYGWFKNLTNESLYETEKTIIERKNIVQGFLFFILVEFMTFAACFWVLFHCGLAPSIWIGALWPGEGVVSVLVCEDTIIHRYFTLAVQLYNLEPCVIAFNLEGLSSTDYYNQAHASYPDRFRVHINLFDKGQLINPYHVPLLNTVILLTSAATVTLSHKSLKLEKYLLSIIFLFITVVLGIVFVKIQYLEYVNSMISGHDGIYGNTFFAITGLHGLHVIIGILFLFICLINIIFKRYSSNLHRSFEFAIWYWHFVDVIWVLVYFLLYLWPAAFFFKEGINIWTISPNYYCINMSVEAYRDILYLNYLRALNRGDKNLFWIGEDLQNYNMNLIRRNVEHYHFFLNMTREYILVKVMTHRYIEKIWFENYLITFLMIIYYIMHDKFLVFVIIVSVYVWFKTDGFDFYPFFGKIARFFPHYSPIKNYKFWCELISAKKAILKEKNISFSNLVLLHVWVFFKEVKIRFFNYVVSLKDGFNEEKKNYIEIYLKIIDTFKFWCEKVKNFFIIIINTFKLWYKKVKNFVIMVIEHEKKITIERRAAKEEYKKLQAELKKNSKKK